MLSLSDSQQRTFFVQLLGDAGCDVIKVERPGFGDDTRAFGPPFLQAAARADSQQSTSTYFLCTNRNKRAIAVDMKTEKGREIILQLAKWADVVVENSVPGKVDEMGLGYADMQRVKPDLIYASISGYGHTGPKSKLPAYDSVIAAAAGLMSITGERDGPPVRPGVALVDQMAGMFMHGAIVQALYARSRGGGGGAFLTTSLFETQLATLANVASAAANAGVDGQRWGTEHASIAPHKAFKACDGQYFFLAAFNDAQFARMARLLGATSLELELNKELLPENASSTTIDCTKNSTRVEYKEAVAAWIQERLFSATGSGAGHNFHGLSRDEVVNVFAQNNIPCAPVNSVKQALEDDQSVALEMLQDVNGHAALGSYKAVRNPVRTNGQSAPIRLPAPTTGQHTRAILQDLTDLSDSQIEACFAERVVE